jgi:type II secretory pathway pseudopilin PulG
MISIVYKQKAAMFGLDARIALAIFAALSVISGSALYKVMDKIKGEQYHQFFKEIVKATEQYYLDNAQRLPQHTTWAQVIPRDLVENVENLPNWNGPYTNSIRASGDGFYANDNVWSEPIWNFVSLLRLTPWATTVEWCAVDNSNCAEWITMELKTPERKAVGQDVFNKLDKIVDNNDGPLSGKVRYWTKDATTDYTAYQGVPRKRI